MTESDFMEGAWLAFIQWAWGFPKMREAFTADTGIAILGPRSGIQSIVDKACGFDPMEGVLDKFVEWATRTHWGAPPKRYREHLRSKRRHAKRKARAR